MTGMVALCLDVVPLAAEAGVEEEVENYSGKNKTCAEAEAVNDCEWVVHWFIPAFSFRVTL